MYPPPTPSAFFFFFFFFFFIRWDCFENCREKKTKFKFKIQLNVNTSLTNQIFQAVLRPFNLLSEMLVLFISRHKFELNSFTFVRCETQIEVTRVLSVAVSFKRNCIKYKYGSDPVKQQVTQTLFALN